MIKAIFNYCENEFSSPLFVRSELFFSFDEANQFAIKLQSNTNFHVIAIFENLED